MNYFLNHKKKIKLEYVLKFFINKPSIVNIKKAIFLINRELTIDEKKDILANSIKSNDLSEISGAIEILSENEKSAELEKLLVKCIESGNIVEAKKVAKQLNRELTVPELEKLLDVVLVHVTMYHLIDVLKSFPFTGMLMQFLV